MTSKRKSLLVLAAMGLIVPACTETAPPPMKPSYAQPTLQPTAKSPASPAQPANTSVANSSAAKLPGANAAVVNPQFAIPVPPEGAQWTLYCQSITGPGHIERATMMKSQLIESTKLPGWYLIHNEGESILYYGYYRSFKDPKDARESARAQADRKTVTSLHDAAGNRPFQLCIFVGLDSPDPSAPAEWNLTNAPGFYTLQIAAYTGSSERKKFAVEIVREAREKYGVDAFYYHGDNVSSVCVGAWPEGSIRLQGAEAMGKNADVDLLVAPSSIPEYALRGMRNKENKAMKVVQEKLEVLDPTLRGMQERYPQHSINGELEFKTADDPANNRKIRIPVPSMIVPIPRAMPSVVDGGGGAGLAADPFGSGASVGTRLDTETGSTARQQLPQRPQPVPARPGAGKLKSVGQ